MQNFKNNNKFLTYMVVGALVMALSISCKSNEDTNSGDTKTQEKTFASYAGAWWGDPSNEGAIHLITINTDGSMLMHNMAGGGEVVSVASSSITKNSDTNYTTTVTEASSGITAQFNFTFSSDTQGTLGMIGDGVNVSIPITKK